MPISDEQDAELDYNVLLTDLPGQIHGFTIKGPEEGFLICINSRLSPSRRLRALAHETAHIRAGDFLAENYPHQGQNNKKPPE